MKISGFTYVRNGFKYGYPFIPSIQSLLPLVDELIVVVGDSAGGGLTLALLSILASDKTKGVVQPVIEGSFKALPPAAEPDDLSDLV